MKAVVRVPNRDILSLSELMGLLIFTTQPRDDAAEYYAAYTGAEKSGYYFEMGE
jgi:hypothetical protein